MAEISEFVAAVALLSPHEAKPYWNVSPTRIVGIAGIWFCTGQRGLTVIKNQAEPSLKVNQPISRQGVNPCPFQCFLIARLESDSRGRGSRP